MEHSSLRNSGVTKIVSSSAKRASDEMKLQDLIFINIHLNNSFKKITKTASAIQQKLEG